jgi:D-alanyl-D-alanine carboxypeptidase (penicillin-binding protein 5/6)
VSAEAAILIETGSGTVLYRKRASKVIPPASLAKVAAIHAAFRLEEAGALDLDAKIAPPRQSWARNMPARSSLMFLGPGQRVSVRRLLKGMAVASGNDAAYALALHAAGSIQDFARIMNREMEELGLTELHFVEPSGLSARNRITARGFARFLRAYIEQWPHALEELHSVRRITYPTEANYVGRLAGNTITQYNRNLLLGDYEGVDGLKTGYIYASGHNFAVTAERDGVRLIAVILGAQRQGGVSGARLLEQDARALLDYGFESFSMMDPPRPSAKPVRVWMGERERVTVAIDGAPREIVVPTWLPGAPNVRVSTEDAVNAPLRAGVPLGRMEVRVGDEAIADRDLVAAHPVDEGTLLRRLWDRFRMLLTA